MKLLSIEPTPSPNVMKLNLDEHWPDGQQRTYLPEEAAHVAEPVSSLLQIQGVRSVFRTADFMAIERKANAGWEELLIAVRAVFGEATVQDAAIDDWKDDYGEVTVYVQMFRKIPMQIRVRAGTEEIRSGLTTLFSQTAMEAGMGSPNLIRERKLVEWGKRYGSLQEVLEMVEQEIFALYPSERLQELKQQALKMGDEPDHTDQDRTRKPITIDEAVQLLTHEDWRVRYAAFERIKPGADTLDVIVRGLRDENGSVRRLAVVYLGDIGDETVLPYLYEALEDRSAAVRRTAGDTLSDIGNPAAGPAMCRALHDKNKLVRWRAARFLYEQGDERAIADLEQASNDPEFEVQMQARIALERIVGGQEAQGSVWQMMTDRNRTN